MRRRLAHLGLALLVLPVVGSIGCTHNHYYYTQPGSVALDPCAPVQQGTTVISSARPVMGTPVVGSVCDDPAATGEGLSRGAPVYSNAGGPLTPAPVYNYARPYNRPFRRGGLAWRSSTPENLATLKVEGTYDPDSTETR